jgi:predicted nucleic acid-binding protein
VALLVLDASVVIALLDARDVHHARALASIEGSRADEKVIPASAFAEVLVVPQRAGGRAVGEFERNLADVPVRIEPVTADIARQAAALRARHSALRLGDALVLATGEILGATVLTADRRWPRYSRRVRVI